MPSDPIANPGTESSRALFEQFVSAANGRSIEDVLSASINMIANCLRQNYGLRSEVEGRIDELFGRAKEILLEHYDPVTGRRRSVVPFDQVVRPHLVMTDDQFTNLGDKRRH
jgi:hypothetical protein